MKCTLCVSHKIFKNPTQKFFSCQNRKSGLSIDGLIISVPFLTFGVRKRQKFFVKVYPERPFEFCLSICFMFRIDCSFFCFLGNLSLLPKWFLHGCNFAYSGTFFEHRKLKVAQIWSSHQSKALIFYFGIKKFLSWIFENFVEKRPTKFHILKFRVCVDTH